MAESSQSGGTGYGLCHCDCGQKTNLSKQTNASRGLVKGEPRRFIVGHNRRSSGIDYLEEDRGYKTPCWIWQRFLSDGYGRVFRGGGANARQILAHRHYSEMHKGPIPDGRKLDHLCEQRPCVNPDHLEAVTSAVNSQRGRNGKLTPEAVAEIRRSDESSAALGRRFGVTSASVGAIRNGRTWKVKPPPPQLNDFKTDLEMARALRAASGRVPPRHVPVPAAA